MNHQHFTSIIRFFPVHGGMDSGMILSIIIGTIAIIGIGIIIIGLIISG